MEKRGYLKFRLYKAINILIAVAVIATLIYSFLNYNSIETSLNEELGENIEKYGYLAVFVLTFLIEISPQPFVSSIFPLLTGVLLGLNPYYLFLMVILSVLASSIFAYYLGISLGRKVTVRLVGKENYNNAHKRFKKHGKWGMAVLALTPIPYFPILGGLFKMKVSDFIIYGIIPRLINFFILGWIFIWVL